MSPLATLLLMTPTLTGPGPDGVRTLSFDTPGPERAAPVLADRPFTDLDDLQTDAVHPGPEELPTGHRSPGGGAPSDLAPHPGDPDVLFAVEDIPGNQYPRKATLYMNFVGADMLVGADNSALNKSTLAEAGPYPAFTGGQQKAIAAAQEMASDVAAFGINVVYENRPGPIAPYTMAMIGGNWTDTNLDDSAAGVAPGADCGALGQRHVVYVFAGGNWSSTAIANVTAQEAGHAWGLDHSVNCGSVMSYCGNGNGFFSGTCDSLCEAGCQGPAGCRLFHEQFCGVGQDRQNEVAELMYLFGGPEPDLEAPVATIVTPQDGEVLEPGSSVPFRASITDNYGGFGWKFVVARDGEIVHDEIDFERDVDEQYLAGLNLQGLEPGVYDLGIVAEDQYGNTATDMVRITVAAGGEAGDDGAADDGASGEDGGTDDGGSGDGASAAGEDGGTDDGAADDGDPGPTTSAADGGSALDDGDGCGCRTRPGTAGSAGWALLLLVGGFLRRRRGRVAVAGAVRA